MDFVQVMLKLAGARKVSENTTKKQLFIGSSDTCVYLLVLLSFLMVSLLFFFCFSSCSYVLVCSVLVIVVFGGTLCPEAVLGPAHINVVLLKLTPT